jgi:hypothetical protein
MINLDGSHESWLIYSDWLEDQDNELCHQIRFDLEEDTNNWTYEWRNHVRGVVGDSVVSVGSLGGIDVVGGWGVIGRCVGGVVGKSYCVGGGVVGDNND